MTTPSVSSDVHESYISGGEKAKIAHLKLCNTSVFPIVIIVKIVGTRSKFMGVVKIPGGVVKIPGMCGFCPRCISRKVGTYAFNYCPNSILLQGAESIPSKSLAVYRKSWLLLWPAISAGKKNNKLFSVFHMHRFRVLRLPPQCLHSPIKNTVVVASQPDCELLAKCIALYHYFPSSL